ncbi:MAG: alkaline phosphatase family protein [Hydrogenophaga sp.]|nr:alkaline phosphatase family protein [Hydrogenophaga sp.]
MTPPPHDPLPPVLAGPILRRVQADRIAWWLACTQPHRVRVYLQRADGAPTVHEPTVHRLRAGKHLWILLIDLALDAPLEPGTWTGYRVELADTDGGPWTPHDDPALCYPGHDTPGFRFAPQVHALLHGSCRKPHHAGGGDGLARADAHLQQLLGEGPGGDAAPWPSALVLSGDQVYCDDVAGPMLRAIHGLMQRLGLNEEAIAGADGSELRCTADLIAHPASYYRREQLLPRTPRSERLIDLVFEGVKKPIFTTDNAHNHLITLGEVIAMYLLAWSPLPWQGLDLSPPPGLEPEHAERYARESEAIAGFREGLGAVRRVLAHLPVAMVFDDHDITDDWNLSREWEDVAYGHPFSRRVIGNALVAYLLNQAWGNRPEAFGDDALLDQVQAALDEPGGDAHEALIERLLHWRDWHYVWPTTPPLMVLDSRTHRWRSEVSPRRPSGLMDWEALTDLQQALRGHPAVLLVASAPIFGVKLIETIQRVFSFFGNPLLVDAENWMSHPGAASAVLNIFRHPRTPQTFVVLSGDVHYSFVYDVELRPRGRRKEPVQGPHIWQICSSGLRNAFPDGLLEKLDHLNRWLFSPRSPLNRFTRRRHMKVTPRKPEGTPHGRRLLNGAGIGLVQFDDSGAPVKIQQLLCDGRDVAFVPREAEARED